jgi:hypothetical protein
MKEQHMQARSHSREAPVSIVMFVCLSACIIATPTGRISVKFDIDVLYQNLSRNYKFSSNWAKISDTLHEDEYVSLLLATYIRCEALLCRPQYFYVAHSDIYSTIHRERIVVFPLQQWLRERAKMLCYAYIACLVKYCSHEI